VSGESGAALRGVEIVKTFHDGEVDTPVLKGVEVEIARGEFVALMGPSGSGKSTLLSILGTLLRPTSGEVEVAGLPTSGLAEREITGLRNRHIGFVFQFHHLLPDFTALENVLFPTYARFGAETRESRRRALELLERVGLSHRADYRSTQLSGGQKQRVAVARAIVNRPDVVLADEPTGNLDRESSAQVMALLREVRDDEGTGFLISTHDPAVAAACDRVIQMVDGRIQTP
jgi:lipoprotein-releasing system ATP-binding protein